MHVYTRVFRTRKTTNYEIKCTYSKGLIRTEFRTDSLRNRNGLIRRYSKANKCPFVNFECHYAQKYGFVLDVLFHEHSNSNIALKVCWEKMQSKINTPECRQTAVGTLQTI